MSFQERRAIMSLFVTILSTVLYAAYVLQGYPAGADAYSPVVFHFWGSFFLLMIPVLIVAHIIGMIFVYIIHAMITQEVEPDITDERDRLVELKGTRNGVYVFALGFILAMLSLVLEMPPAVMFIILISGGIGSEIVSELSQFFYYRRGV